MSRPCLEDALTIRYLHATDGNDSNDGCTPATAWKHREYAWEHFLAYDMNNKKVRIQLLSNFMNSCQIFGSQFGQRKVEDFEFYGDDTYWDAPGLRQINADLDGIKLWDVQEGARFQLRGMTLRNAGINGFGVAVGGGTVYVKNMWYGQHGAVYGAATGGAALDVCGNISLISATGYQVWLSEQSRFGIVAEGTGNIFVAASLVGSGSPLFTECFAQASTCSGYIDFAGTITSLGSSQGLRSRSIGGGLVHTPGVILLGSHD